MTTRQQHGRPGRHQPSAVGKSAGVRERILAAALDVMKESGVRHLSQVRVAQRAGVRQSHLTYYFPTREDLLQAVTRHAVDGMTSGLRRATTGDADADDRRLLDRLARSVTARAHMRMFVAMIVEADDDPAVRAVMRDATGLMEAHVAEALGGDHAHERARFMLAAIWGLGLYGFLMRPGSDADPTDQYLAWIAGTLPGRKGAGASQPRREDQRESRRITR